jgi:hypothetical protein
LAGEINIDMNGDEPITMPKRHIALLNWLFARPWLVAICVFIGLLILPCFFCTGLTRFELATILLGIATLETLIVI